MPAGPSSVLKPSAAAAASGTAAAAAPNNNTPITAEKEKALTPSGFADILQSIQDNKNLEQNFALYEYAKQNSPEIAKAFAPHIQYYDTLRKGIQHRISATGYEIPKDEYAVWQQVPKDVQEKLKAGVKPGTVYYWNGEADVGEPGYVTDPVKGENGVTYKATFDGQGNITGYTSDALTHVAESTRAAGRYGADGSPNPNIYVQSSGGFFGDIFGGLGDLAKSMGPIPNIALAVATGGLSIPEQLAAQTALNMGKGQDFGDALKGAAVAVGGSQLFQGAGGSDAVSGMDLASDLGAGNTLADVGAALNAGAPAATGIEALTPELNIGTAAPPVSTGIEALTPELNIGTAAPAVPDVTTAPVTSGTITESPIPSATTSPTAPGGIESLTPELNVGTAAPPASTGIEALTPELNVGTATPPAPPAPPTDYTPELNVGTAAPPASQGITALPTEPVSGMDLAADATPGNTIADAGAVATTPPQGLTTDANQTAAETNRLLGQEATAAGTPVGTTPGWLGGLADATGIPVNVLNGLAASLGIKALTGALEPDTITSQGGSYTGPLANIQYNPGTYTPYEYKPYAGGGPIESMSNANAVGANTGYPMAHMQRGSYAVPYQQPISQNVVTGSSASRVDPYTGEQLLAGGGIASLGGYSDGGQLLRGPGDGVSDSIPAVIGNKQPARLADGEFVVPARIVSELGNGSTEAGARQLYAMMDRIQAARRKTTGKDKVAANTKAAKHLPA